MYVETAEDLTRKYGRSFALLDNKLVYFREFVESGEEGGVIAYLHEEGSSDTIERLIRVDSISSLAFDAMYVNVSYAPAPKRTTSKWEIPGTLFKRSPTRQWRRGLAEDNTIITCPLTSLYQSMGKVLYQWNGGLSYPLIKALQNPEYPSYNEAIERCQKEQCVAISSMFAVCLSTISPDHFLVSSVYGFVAEGIKDHIFVRHTPSQQEITDYITRTKQDIRMEVAPCHP